MVLALREEHRLRLRQPIESIYLDKALAGALQPYESMLKALCNCKTIHWEDTKCSTLFDKKIHLASDLGARLKRGFKPVKDAFAKQAYRVAEDGETIVFESGQTLSLRDKEFFYVVETNHPGFAYKSKGEIWVLINTQLTLELTQEGLVRDILRELVKLRIQDGYQPDDVMALYISEKYQALFPQLESMLPAQKYRLIWTNPEGQLSSGDAYPDIAQHTFKIGERGSETLCLAHAKFERGFQQSREVEDYSLHRFFKGAPSTSTHKVGAENGLECK